MTNFHEIKWFNQLENTWVTDFINDDENDPFVISFNEKTNVYSFCLARTPKRNIYDLLESSINELLKLESNRVNIINLIIKSYQSEFISGSFQTEIGMIK